MQKHKSGILAFICFAMMFFTNQLSAQFAGGTGTEIDPWQISTPEQLASVNNYLTATHSDKFFKLINNIDVSTYISAGNPGYHDGYGWYPLGRRHSPFFGKFDGAGFTVTGVNIDGTLAPNADYEMALGFFGETGNSFVLKNLTVQASFVIGMTNIGGMVGVNSGYIVNCRVIMLNGGMVGYPPFNLITGVGGFVGWNKGTISKCSFSGGVIGKWRVGGFAGFHGGGIIKDCYATGKVQCVENIGGFTGVCNSPVVNCYTSVIMEWDPQTLYKGGFGANNINNNYYTGCYWNKELSNLATSPGSDPSFGKTTAQMKLQVSFVGWDFTNTWQINSAVNGGMPTLRLNNPPTSSDMSSVIQPAVSYTLALSDFPYIDADNEPMNKIKIGNAITNGTLYLNGAAVNVNQEILAADISAGKLTFLSSGQLAASFGFRVSDGMDYSLAPYTRSFTVADYFNGGNGTAANPYQIVTAQQLNSLHNFLDNTGLGLYFKQMNNLDLSSYASGEGWLPIGNQSGSFKGNFDGGGFTISNLLINRSTGTIGLFGSIASGGLLKNVNILGGNVTGGSSTGMLVGLNAGGSVVNSSVDGIVRGSSFVGGMVGYNDYLTTTALISGCYSTADVVATVNSAGGLVGQNSYTAGGNASIENSYATGMVSAVEYAGGLVGSQSVNGKTTNCFAAGKVTNSGNPANKGGLIGSGSGTISSSYWDKEATGVSTSAGVAATYGRFTSDMLRKATYTGWDFSTVWDHALPDNHGYPHLIRQTFAPNFAGGSGTAADPYQISTAEHLNSLRAYTTGGLYFKMLNNIDLTAYIRTSAAGWFPLADSVSMFSGQIDGCGFKISGMRIYRPLTNQAGLFAHTATTAVLKNINIVTTPADSITARYCVGGLVGFNRGNVSGCSSTGRVRGNCWTGGLVGWNDGTVSESFSAGAVNSNGCTVGGLVGQNDRTVINCYSHASARGLDYVGGLVGHQRNLSAITTSFATGKVTNTGNPANKGGLLGFAGAPVNNSYWDRESSGMTTSCNSANTFGKTTAEMKMKTTFSGWDFNNVWRITESSSYPYHSWNQSVNYAGAYTIGSGGSFTDLTGGNGFFNAINHGVVTGNLTANIISDLTENGATALNQWTESGAGNYSLTIQPNNGTLRTISGSASANSALIRLNGADRVIIDGQTGKLLTFINSNSTAGDAGAVIGLDNGSDNCTVTNCNISNSNPASTAVTGITIGNANGVKISKNKIFGLNGNAAATVTGIKYSGTAAVLTGTVANNMISLIPTTTGIVSGISYSGNVQNSLDLYYNSIYIGGTQSGSANSYGFLKSSDGANLNIKDNIFHNARTNSTGTGKHYAVAFANTVGTVAEDYNLLYSASNLAGLYGSADKSTLTNWISDTPYDDNSKSSVISFENEAAGNLAFKRVTANSAVYNTGVTVSGITEDFFGKARPQYGREDMGAHELEQSSGLEENILPTETQLSQNYPNPFNPVTAINYELRIADNVKLTVFNAKGEMVKTLVNGMQNAGRYSVNFDGAGFNSGVYFYKLEADGKSMVKRMLMVK